MTNKRCRSVIGLSPMRIKHVCESMGAWVAISPKGKKVIPILQSEARNMILQPDELLKRPLYGTTNPSAHFLD